MQPNSRERLLRGLHICVSAAPVDFVGQGEQGTAGWFELCGRRAGNQPRSDEGQLSD